MTLSFNRYAMMQFVNNLAASFQLTIARMKLQDKVARERRQLLKLDEHELRDIGITRQMAVKEARRSETDIPQSRLAELDNCNCVSTTGKKRKA